MSVKAMAWAFEQKVGDSLAKIILLALADFANDEGICWPSTERLAHKAECARTTLFDKFDWLRERGLLAKLNRQKEQKPSIYILNLRGVDQQDLEDTLSAVATSPLSPAPTSPPPPLSSMGDKDLSSTATSPCRPGRTMNPSVEEEREDTQNPSCSEKNLETLESRKRGLIGSDQDPSQPPRRTKTFSEFDFVSEDCTVHITAQEFVDLGTTYPHLKNIRAIVRQKCRDWLPMLPAGERKRALLNWLAKRDSELAAKASSSETAEQRKLKQQAKERAEWREREAQRKRRMAFLEEHKQRRAAKGGG